MLAALQFDKNYSACMNYVLEKGLEYLNGNQKNNNNNIIFSDKKEVKTNVRCKICKGIVVQGVCLKCGINWKAREEREREATETKKEASQK